MNQKKIEDTKEWKREVFFQHCESFTQLMFFISEKDKDFEGEGILTGMCIAILAKIAATGEQQDSHKKYLLDVTKMLAEAYNRIIKDKEHGKTP